MATSNAATEKIVRKVLDEELSERNEATLEAIERLGRVLTEEVIPRLGDVDEGDTGEETEAEPGAEASPMRRSDMTPRPEDGEGSEDDIGFPDDENEPGVPEPVLEAFEALYRSLSAEQANALEALFAAIASEPADDAGEPESPPETEPVPQKPTRPRARVVS